MTDYTEVGRIPKGEREMWCPILDGIWDSETNTIPWDDGHYTLLEGREIARVREFDRSLFCTDCKNPVSYLLFNDEGSFPIGPFHSTRKDDEVCEALARIAEGPAP